MNSRRRVALSALLAGLLILPPSAAWGYTSVQFANRVEVGVYGAVLSTKGTHVGGQVYGLPAFYGTTRVAMIQGSGFIGSASGASQTCIRFGPTGSAYTNSQVQCRYTSSYGVEGALSCWRFKA